MVADRSAYVHVNGLELSRFMLGTAQLGLNGYGINNSSEHVDANALLSCCENNGIKCYDTACSSRYRYTSRLAVRIIGETH